MIDLVHTISETRIAIQKQISAGKTIGFVPTMGALHEGHLKLIRQAAAENDFVAVSIFVNPIQFNNPEDLAKYPRTLDDDLKKLVGTGCSLVFAPSAQEMYPEPDLTEFDFGELDKVMEGKFRPGHFEGVAIVVKRLFEIVTPHKAYFGEKDFQQLAIIKKMVEKMKLPIEIVACPIIREADGLAMSSRNVLLQPQHRALAPLIHKTLLLAVEKAQTLPLEKIKTWVVEQINSSEYLKVEYFDIVDENRLTSLKSLQHGKKQVGCIAVWAGNVRLIDNIVFNL